METADFAPTAESLLKILERLRAPGGCPWDREQTRLTLSRSLAEECAEFLDAVDRDDPADLCDELGDLFMNVVFQAVIAAEKGEFIATVFCGYGEDTIRIEDVDLSPYCSNVEINRWTINGNLSQCCHKVGGDLFQHHQEVGGSLFQNNQKVGCNLYQDGQEAGGGIAQDKQEAKDESVCKDESMCVEPDYEGECERLRKELREANRKNEVLLWALGKAMEEAGE